MKYKGIKGKWEVIEFDMPDFKRIIICSDESKGVLAHIYLPDNKITDELKSTANLMSNSYDLLKALSHAIKLLKTTTEYEVLDDFQNKTKKLQEVFEKAII